MMAFLSSSNCAIRLVLLCLAPLAGASYVSRNSLVRNDVIVAMPHRAAAASPYPEIGGRGAGLHHGLGRSAAGYGLARAHAQPVAPGRTGRVVRAKLCGLSDADARKLAGDLDRLSARASWRTGQHLLSASRRRAHNVHLGRRRQPAAPG